MRLFVHSLRSEWLKLKRSLVGWLIVGAAFFVPAIILASRLRRPDLLPTLYLTEGFWEKLWTMTWESNSIMILPMTMILVTSLVIQIEYRNNTWKQLHASPQPLIVIYAAKLCVILILLVQLLVLFNVGIFISGSLPSWIFADVPFSRSAFPVALFLDRSARFFIDTLPIVAVQYLLALRFRNFIAPLGIGLAAWIFSLGMLSTSYNYVVPYAYAGMDYLVDSHYKAFPNLPAAIQELAVGYFVVSSIAGFGFYALRSDKG